MGATVTLVGRDMYQFLDKLTQMCLPRLPDWPGVPLTDTEAGEVRFILPANALALFPDVENHYDMFPKLVETQVTFTTSAHTPAQAALLLSAFQVPVQEPPVVEVKEEEDKEIDTWSQLALLKTRTERKAMAASLSTSGRKK